jgi:ribose 5-phosphate isomerase A
MADERPLITDNHNFIVDCKFPNGIADPATMEQVINAIPGVLENGLFVNMAGRILVGNDQGDVRLIP